MILFIFFVEYLNSVNFVGTHYVVPDYDPLTLENDIGLIKLRMPVEYSRKSIFDTVQYDIVYIFCRIFK
jgi:hypothetical protein